MSIVDSPVRAVRGKSLVVGASADAQRILAAIDGPATCAENMFDALGQLAAATAREPIASVILATGDPDESLREAAASIRRLDPSVQLLLVCDGGADARAARRLADAFDRVIVERDTAGLRDALRGEASRRTSQPAEALVVETPRRADVAEPRHSNAEPATPPAPIATPPAPIATRPASLDQESTSRPAVHAPPAEPRTPADYFLTDPGSATADSSERLGDVDLIDAILHSPDRLVERAIRLIVQQTSFQDIQLLVAEPSARSLASAPVRFEDQNFGFLASAHARPDELATWADWLARWLALGESHARHREWAYQDDLTEAWNRRYFNEFLADVIRAAQKQRRPVTLMVFDIDDFKRYNDQFGHEAGDEILRETVKLLTSVIRKGDRVCRIGGDEFAVIFADPEGPRGTGSTHPETVEQIARRFQDQICAMKFPKLAAEAPGPLTISAGLATYPWDGHDPASLLTHADELALESKRRGKNVMTLGPGAARSGGHGASDSRTP